jgi:hypothetical protein
MASSDAPGKKLWNPLKYLKINLKIKMFEYKTLFNLHLLPSFFWINAT